MDALLEPFELPFVQRGLIEVLILAVPAGLLGTWIVLRGLAFFSHAIGTASFPGLVLADGLGFAAPLGAFAAGARAPTPLWRWSWSAAWRPAWSSPATSSSPART
jgi:ABC-type Mn2+/Zn2+ transport system permease subunit